MFAAIVDFPSFSRQLATIITFALVSPFLKALIGWETILPEVLQEKISGVLCRLSKKSDPNKERKNIFQKAEEKLHFCSVLGNNTENIKNFFISNHKVASIYLKLWTAKKSNRLPLIFLTSFRLLIICFFIMTIVHQFLTENPKMTLLLVLMSIFMLTRSRWLFNQYMKMENQFLSNLHGQTVSDEETTEKSATKEKQ